MNENMKNIKIDLEVKKVEIDLDLGGDFFWYFRDAFAEGFKKDNEFGDGFTAARVMFVMSALTEALKDEAKRQEKKNEGTISKSNIKKQNKISIEFKYEKGEDASYDSLYEQIVLFVGNNMGRNLFADTIYKIADVSMDYINQYADKQLQNNIVEDKNNKVKKPRI
jgi:hypothetical protein